VQQAELGSWVDRKHPLVKGATTFNRLPKGESIKIPVRITHTKKKYSVTFSLKVIPYLSLFSVTKA
jgi:hypothetical protein